MYNKVDREILFENKKSNNKKPNYCKYALSCDMKVHRLSVGMSTTLY